MKKLLLILGTILSFSALAHALDMDVWLSSNTATVDTMQVLCGMYAVGSSSVVYHAVIHSVIVSSTATATTANLTLYNSTWTTTGTQSIGPINTQAIVPNYNYDVVFPNGLIYSKTGNAQVQMIYQCY